MQRPTHLIARRAAQAAPAALLALLCGTAVAQSLPRGPMPPMTQQDLVHMQADLAQADHANMQDAQQRPPLPFPPGAPEFFHPFGPVGRSVLITLHVRDSRGEATYSGLTTENKAWVSQSAVEHSYITPVATPDMRTGIVIESAGKSGLPGLHQATYDTGIAIDARPGVIDANGNLPLSLDFHDSILTAVKKRTINGVPFDDPDVVVPHLRTNLVVHPGEDVAFAPLCDTRNSDMCVSLTVRVDLPGKDADKAAAAPSTASDVLANGNEVTVHPFRVGDPCTLGGGVYPLEHGTGYCDGTKIVVASDKSAKS